MTLEAGSASAALAVATSTGIAPLLTPWSLLTATAGLVAFHIGLYTLVGRERKSPYVINLVFPIFILCLLVAAISLFSTLLPANWASCSLSLATILLCGAFVWSAINVYKVAIRFIYFVDSIRLQDLPIIRGARRWRVMKNVGQTYPHNPNPVPPELKDEIFTILKRFEDHWDSRDIKNPQSLAVSIQHQGQGNSLLAEIAVAFLQREFTVQYLTASRHPIEFVKFLENTLIERTLSLKQYRKHIVVIDAYSPHFAFLDSIYIKKDQELVALGITRIPAAMTYAGMHSASSRGFKAIQRQVTGTDRNPTLVVYEDAYALSDLESAEQYRIFVRHVMPSERMWDGMFTVFLESAQPEQDWKILQAYANMTLDLRSPKPTVGNGKSPSNARQK